LRYLRYAFIAVGLTFIAALTPRQRASVGRLDPARA
jgi:hypothetical protein